MPVAAPKTNSGEYADKTRSIEDLGLDSEYSSLWSEDSLRHVRSVVGHPAAILNIFYGGPIVPTHGFTNVGGVGFAKAEIETVRTGLVEVLRENARLRTEVASMRTLLLQLRDNLFDLSPVTLYEVDTDSGILRLRIPRNIEVRLSQDGKLLCAVDDFLGIDAVAKSRTELIRDVHDQLKLVWAEFAQAPDDTLSMAARSLKARLLDSIEEV